MTECIKFIPYLLLIISECGSNGHNQNGSRQSHANHHQKPLEPGDLNYPQNLTIKTAYFKMRKRKIKIYSSYDMQPLNYWTCITLHMKPIKTSALVGN